MVTLNLPTGIISPMEVLPADKPFDDPDFLYQVKWDGVRMMAYLTKNGLVLINRRLHIRTDQYPELQELSRLVKVLPAVLDGEVVVLKNGKPSFSSVMSRDLTSSIRQISQLTKQLPIHYMVFDILYASQDLRNQPLQERQTVLKQVLTTDDNIHLVEDFDRGSTLLDAVKSQDLEGIVAKRRSSLYISGKKHRDWYKIKYRRVQDCVVGGYTLRGTLINSLLLGVYQDQQFIYVGRAGTGLKESEWGILTRELPASAISYSPFSNKPFSSRYHFVKPQLVVRVEFAEWTETLTLRSPVITGFSGHDASLCTFD